MDAETADVDHATSGDEATEGVGQASSEADAWIKCTRNVIYSGQIADTGTYAVDISQEQPDAGLVDIRYRTLDDVEVAQVHLREVLRYAVAPDSPITDTVRIVCFSQLPEDHTFFGQMVRIIHPLWIDDQHHIINGMVSLRRYGGGVETTETRPALLDTDAGGPPNVTYSLHVPGLIASFVAYYTSTRTTVILVQALVGVLTSQYLLHDLIASAVPLHIPRMPSHPLAGLMILCNRLVTYKRQTSDAITIERIVREAGFHNYTNWERKDVMALPPQELVSYTAKMVGTSTGLLARTAELQGTIEALSYLCGENAAVETWCHASDMGLAYHHVNEWARYLKLQAKSVQIYEESLASTSSLVVQGLQNIIGQKNQEEMRQIALESRGVAEESKRLTEESRKIAEASWKDTTSVTAVTLITMLFLPATFMATLFSTDFIKDGAFDGHFVRQRTVYIAATVPLTVVTVVMWFGWTNYKRRREEIRIKRRETLEIEKKNS